MSFNEITGLMANLCTIAGFVIALCAAVKSISIVVSVKVSIIRNKKHDQCSRTDRALDDR